jgi:hypothetical protein
MSENDEKLVIKLRTVRMADGSIHTFWSREKSRFVDNNGVECVALEVFDPNVQHDSLVMEITGSVIAGADATDRREAASTPEAVASPEQSQARP